MNLSFLLVTSLALFRLKFELFGASVKPFHFAVLLSLIILISQKKVVLRYLNQNIKVLMLAFLAYLSLTVNQSIYSYSIAYSLFYVILSIIILLSWLILIYEHNLNSKCIDKVSSYFFKLFLIGSLVLYIYSFPEYLNRKISTGTDLLGIFVDRGMPRLTGLHEDPNIICIICIPAILFFIFNEQYKNIFFACCGFIVLLLTFSRGGIAVFLLIFSVVLTFSNSRYKFLYFSSLVVTILVVFLTLNTLFDVGQLVENRFDNIGNASGRVEIWTNVWHGIEQRPGLGFGPYSMKEYGADHWQKGRLAHNTFLQIWFDQGLVGLLFYYNIYMIIAIIIVSSVGLKSYHLYSFLSICMVSLNVSVGMDEFVFLLFMLIMLSALQNKNSSKFEKFI